MATDYSAWIGFKKTLKNLAIVLIPAFLANQAAILVDLPEPYRSLASILVAGLAYFYKNRLENQ